MKNSAILEPAGASMALKLRAKMAFLLFASALGGWAQGVDAAADSRPVPVQQLMAHGFEVEKSFNAEGGLTGWVVRRAGKSAVVYTTPDQAHLIIGSLIDARGQDLTSGYAELYGDKPDYESLFNKLDSARYIAEGATRPKAILRVFFDPNCVFCRSAWRTLKPYEDSGLQVRWIPVAFLKPTSIGRVAAILEARQPAEALAQNEKDFNEKTEDGGIKPSLAPSAATTIALAANRELMDSFGGNGTPLLVWRGKDGKVQFASGLPPTSDIAEMIGMSPPQSNAAR